ncbi:MAG: TonB family protein [Brevundimonas sp.]|nr:MAG: TonB family protein [Brevundimonas sp.]
MIAFAIAAALLLDPTPKQTVNQKPAAGVETVRDDATSGTILSSVAVTLECTARANGRVENCKVLGETHPGLGFGEAAIALMRDAEVEPGPRDVQFARTIQFMP